VSGVCRDFFFRGCKCAADDRNVTKGGRKPSEAGVYPEGKGRPGATLSSFTCSLPERFFGLLFFRRFEVLIQLGNIVISPEDSGTYDIPRKAGGRQAIFMLPAWCPKPSG
jgi:hypothetical protein